MIRFATCITALLAGLVLLAHSTTAQEPADAKVRLGIYDSRVLATAYYRSEQFADSLSEMMERYETAKAAGDDETVASIEATVKKRQEHIHLQGFGTEPVDNILELLEDQLPEIAARAGVDVIVCKWDVAYRNPAASSVEVSFAMSDAFNPDEETLRVMKEMGAEEPVPAEELENHEH